MPDPATDFADLTLRIQHLLDAELLLESAAAGLLAEADAARRAQECGDAEARRRHLKAVVGTTEALIRSGALVRSDARAVFGAANGLLDQDICRGG